MERNFVDGYVEWQANPEITDMVRREANATLGRVLYELSNQMKNSYSRSDA